MKKLPIMLLALLVLLPANAQQEWTLRQCIEYAIENNLVIKRSENDVETGNINVSTAKWARLPNLSGSVGQSFGWGRSLSPVWNEETQNNDYVYVDSHTRSSSFSLGTNIPIFTGMELPNQLSLAKLNLKAAIADLENAKEDMALNVASYYVKVLYAEELSMIAQEQVILTKSQLDRITKLYEVGKASPAEVSEVRARVAQDEMSAVQADNNYRLALLDLSQALELPTPEGFAIESPKVAVDFPALTPPEEIYLIAITDRPNILAAQYRLEGSEKSIRIAQSDLYPSLTFNASLSTNYYSSDRNAFRDQLSNNFNKYMGFSLSIPIFNRFSTRNRIRTARVQQLNYGIQLDQAKKEIYKEIQQAWYNALTSESKFNSSEVAVDASEDAFRLMTEKYENGKATFIEYNESKLNLTKAMSDQVQAKYEYMFNTKILNFYKGIPIE